MENKTKQNVHVVDWDWPYQDTMRVTRVLGWCSNEISVGRGWWRTWNGNDLTSALQLTKFTAHCWGELQPQRRTHVLGIRGWEVGSRVDTGSFLF